MDGMSEQERRALAQANSQVAKVLSEYQAEIARLRREQAMRRVSEGKMDSEFEDLMQENEKLSEKLEHLQDVFVHGDGAGAGGGAGGGGGWGQSPQKAMANAASGELDRVKSDLERALGENAGLQEELAAAHDALASRNDGDDGPSR